MTLKRKTSSEKELSLDTKHEELPIRLLDTLKQKLALQIQKRKNATKYMEVTITRCTQNLSRQQLKWVLRISDLQKGLKNGHYGRKK